MEVGCSWYFIHDSYFECFCAISDVMEERLRRKRETEASGGTDGRHRCVLVSRGSKN